MAEVTANYKRLLLRGLRWDAQESALTLEAALKSACRSQYADTKLGQVLIGTSGNGASVTFALPSGSSELTPAAVATAVGGLYDLYAECRADLVTGGTPSPTDDQILTEMLDRIKPVRSAYADRSGMCLR